MFVSPHDARRLSPTAQADLRRRVVQAIRKQGLSQAAAAQTFGVARPTVNRWMKSLAEGGHRALRGQKRGRPPGTQLEPLQAALTVKQIVGHCPDQLRLPFALWTREAVQLLLQQRFGLEVSVWTVGRYLKHWGLSPQKPVRRAYEQDPVAVTRWMKVQYPRIHRQAKAEHGEIWWCDEMGLRSDHQTGTTWGRRGETPVVPGTGQRFRCNRISALTNRGRLAFMLFESTFTEDVFLDFLKRMIRLTDRKIFLIVDRHRVHRSRKVKRWLCSNREKIRLDYLPPYSPELNPDELLNQDLKSNALGRQRPVNKEEMKVGVRSYLRSTQRQPRVVKNFFRKKHVRYAAAV